MEAYVDQLQYLMERLLPWLKDDISCMYMYINISYTYFFSFFFNGIPWAASINYN